MWLGHAALRENGLIGKDRYSCYISLMENGRVLVHKTQKSIYGNMERFKDLSMSGYQSKIERIAFSNDSRWLAVACLGDLSIWDFSGKGPAGTEPASASEHNNHIEDLAWSPACESIVTGGADGRTIIWKKPSKQVRNYYPWRCSEHPWQLFKPVFSWVGKMVVLPNNYRRISTIS